VAKVDADWRAMREDRDGTEHHITVVAKNELDSLSLKVCTLPRLLLLLMLGLDQHFSCALPHTVRLVC
jgi:hypothetical protein